MTQQERECLEEQWNRLMNSFGSGSWQDGLVQERIAAIEARIVAAGYPKPDYSA